MLEFIKQNEKKNGGQAWVVKTDRCPSKRLLKGNVGAEGEHITNTREGKEVIK